MMQASKSESYKTKRERERKRIKKPKVKTGCKTCKIRRVKCDETRPECLRCQRFGKNYCDGYDHVSSAPGSRSPSRQRDPSVSQEVGRPILRKSSSGLHLIEPQRGPENQMFNSEDEYRCFCLYREEVAHQLSCFDGSIWSQLLLQASEQHTCIRHALIAIGGLGRSMKMMCLESQDENDFSPRKFAHLHGLALEHYDKFLAGTKQYMASLTDAHGRRKAMICCLLVVCIENIQLNHKNALAHAQQGSRLVEQMSDESPSTAEIVERELEDQFKRMELRAFGIHNSQAVPVEQHRKVMNAGSSNIASMPEEFATINEARSYLDLMMRRAFHFVAYAVPGRPALVIYRDEPDEPSELDALKGQLSGMLEIRSGLQEAQEMYLFENKSWNRAFEPLLQSVVKDINHVDAFRVLLLKAHSLTTKIRLIGCLSTSELIWDSMISEMESLMRILRAILHHPHAFVVFAERSFTFDMGVIYPLFIIGTLCRDRRLRREAIDLLSIRPWTEGQIMSQIAGDIARFIMETDESGIQTEPVPEWARARYTGVEIVQEQRKGIVHCVRGSGSSMVHVESVRDWSNMGP